MARAGIELNGVRYRRPSRPVVVVCIDGGDPAYFDRGVRDGVVPNVARFMKTGFAAVADGDVPSFTCPNNMSITTGSPPAVHGISGNFYLDRETGEAVVMTGPDLLRSRTIMAEFSRHGARVVSITAKDKLRRQLGKDMDLAGGSVNFSSECAEQCTLEEHGIENVLEFVGMPLPDIYSPELSLFVLEAGIRLLERRQPGPCRRHEGRQSDSGSRGRVRPSDGRAAVRAPARPRGRRRGHQPSRHLHRRVGKRPRPLRPPGPSPSDARRHLRGEGAVHPEPAAPRGVCRPGRGRAAQELPDLRFRDQRCRMRPRVVALNG